MQVLRESGYGPHRPLMLKTSVSDKGTAGVKRPSFSMRSLDPRWDSISLTAETMALVYPSTEDFLLMIGRGQAFFNVLYPDSAGGRLTREQHSTWVSLPAT